MYEDITIDQPQIPHDLLSFENENEQLPLLIENYENNNELEGY